MFPGFRTRMLASMTESDLRAGMPPVSGSELGVGDLPTGTVTLLLADVEDSTRLWEIQPAEMTAAVQLLDHTLAELLAAHGGVRPVEQGEGDSFVAAFARATEAVACALALQQTDLAPIRLRIGLHTGEVQLRDAGNYIGPAINRTARIRDLAHGGQTVLSGTTEDLVAEALPGGAWRTDLGKYELRGVARPERVAQLCHPEVRNEFPPLRTGKPIAAERLPVQLTSFIGRGAELEDVRMNVVGNRLITLTATGGAGKTRLAIEVAGRLAADFADGVWYVDLASIADGDLVPGVMAKALTLVDQPSRSTVDTLIRSIGSRHMMVVLDNCEHLVDATAALVTTLLSNCPGMTFLATSREPIGVAGEVTWRVPSMSLNDDAIALFIDRAHRARADFTLNDNDIHTISEICARLDGMPLAIELAAARVRALSLDEIVSSLHDRFRLLTGGRRTAVRRQQTLRASVDWSHALLTESERILFRRLAPFLGGFDLAAARAVAAVTEIERYQVFDQLALLVDKSLVVADGGGGRTRYRLLETVRQYALEKLGESGEADDVRVRHCDYYTGLAARLDAPAATGHQQLVDEAEAEIDNLRAAFAWSRESGDIERALQIASTLQPLWLTRGPLREGLGWIDDALAELRSSDGEIAPTVLARALADGALFDGWLGVPERREQAAEALAIARSLDDPALLVRALTACFATAALDAEHVAAFFAEAIELARQLGDKWRLSQLLGFQAYGAAMTGNALGARAAATEGRILADAIGDRFAAGMCRAWGLGGSTAMLGDLHAAEVTLREFIADADTTGDPLSKFNGLLVLSPVLGWSGKWAESLTVSEAVAESGAELGPIIEGLGDLSLGVAHLAAGDIASAEHSFERGYSRIPDISFTQANLSFRSEAALAAGDFAKAAYFADQGVASMTGYFGMWAVTARARVALAADDPEAAERDAHDALARASDTRVLIGLPAILELLAHLASDDQSYAEAARLIGAAQGIRQRTGEVRYAIYRADHETLLNAIRDAMGQNNFDSAYSEGAALTTEEAISYARRGRGERKRPSTGWAALTPTELDVARLVSEGLGNKDIGVRLFVSPRTVETHLGHIYAKLGYSSRVQLAQEAARRS